MGRPDFCQSSTVFCAVKGANSLGLKTTVLPASSAGMICPLATWSGELKVPKTATGPWGLNRARAGPPDMG